MVLKVTASGTITVKVELPAANPAVNLMNGSTVTLSPNVTINP